jgi:hypothetical protein
MKMMNESPKCRCSACVLSPLDSHGVHLIGMFYAAHTATMRGRSPISVPEQVLTYWADGRRGVHASPFPFAASAR